MVCRRLVLYLHRPAGAPPEVDMLMENVNRWHGAALALTTALTFGAVAVAGPAAPTASAAPGPCGPLGTLVEYELNDRCDYNTMDDPMLVGDRAVVRALRTAGLFATMQPCLDERTFVPVAAVPDELLITAGSAERLAVALQTVRRRLENQVIGEPLPVNALAARLTLQPGTLTPRFMRFVVPTLQGRGWSADLNYFEPAMPNNRFHPFDNPVEAPPEAPLKGGDASVLVVDSPPQSEAVVFDLDGNGKVDEDHGHGDFVASVVKLLAPTAEVVLAGVHGGQVPGVARWSPMMFSDADLISAMGTAFGLSPGGTAVRRGFDVVNLSLGGVGCDGIAARLPLGRFMRDLAGLADKWTEDDLLYVAAAGNDGGDVKHFPAAWRDQPTIDAAADAVDLALSGGAPTVAGNEIRQIQAFLEDRTIAVGSWTAGVRDPFSNCGTWVNGKADGADAVGAYPSKTGAASWSGTSFATPRVSAVIAGGTNPGDIAYPAVGTC
jgi:Subtilase family